MVYFFTRVQFKWTQVELSYFSTYNLVTTFLGKSQNYVSLISSLIYFYVFIYTGTTIIIELLSKRLQIADSLIAIFATLSKITANAVYASSFTSWLFYAGAAVEMFTTGTGIAVRSIGSKVVLADEVGKLNALLGLVESLEPTLYAPLYLAVWDATRDSFTGAFLLMSIALILPALLIFA